MNITGSIAPPCHVPQELTIDLAGHALAGIQSLLGQLVEALQPLVTERTAESLLRAEQAVQVILGLAAGQIGLAPIRWTPSR